jgi:hypothetical protein
MIKFTGAEKRNKGVAQSQRGKPLLKTKIPGSTLKFINCFPNKTIYISLLGPKDERNNFPLMKSGSRHSSKSKSLKRRRIIVRCCGKKSCYSGLLKKRKNPRLTNSTVELANKGTEKVIAIIFQFEATIISVKSLYTTKF